MAIEILREGWAGGTVGMVGAVVGKGMWDKVENTGTTSRQ